MGNLAELFISFILASGQWAGPIQQGSAPDPSVSVQEPIQAAARSLGLSPGDRVRFSTAEKQPVTEGNVVAADPEALLMKLPGAEEPVRIPWSSLRRLEAYRGQHSLARRGAKIGALSVGIPFAVISFFIAALGNIDCEAHCNDGWPEFPAALVGGAVGAGIGALVGSSMGEIFKVERWDEVDLPPIRVSVTPQRGRGLTVALSLRF